MLAALLLGTVGLLGWTSAAASASLCLDGSLQVPGVDAAVLAGCRLGWDYGDAPAPYPTGLLRDGPRHWITTVGTLTIGTTVTPDAGGRHDDGDADDGLVSPVRVSPEDPQVTVVVRNTTGMAALLAGWLDTSGRAFSRSERARVRVPPGATRVALRWVSPVRVVSGTGELRLRLYQGIPFDPVPIGVAIGGEVEDYRVTILPAPPPSATPTPSATPKQPSPQPAPVGGPTPPTRPGPAQPRTPQPTPPASLPTPSASTSTRPRPRPSAMAMRMAQSTPWRPRRGLPVTWSVVVLVMVPTVAGAAHVAGRRIARRAR